MAVPLSEVMPPIMVELDEDDLVMDAVVILNVAPVNGRDRRAGVYLASSEGISHVTYLGLMHAALDIITRGGDWEDYEDDEEAE